MKKFIINTIIFINIILISNVRAVLTEDEKEFVKNGLRVNVGSQHKYNLLYQSSENHYKHRIFNRLSRVTKVTSIVTSACAAYLSLIPKEDRDITSGILSISTVLLVSLDEYFWQRSARHYAEAPDKLEQFLTEEAINLYSTKQNINEIEKIEVKNIVKEVYESYRLRKVKNEQFQLRYDDGNRGLATPEIGLPSYGATVQTSSLIQMNEYQ